MKFSMVGNILSSCRQNFETGRKFHDFGRFFDHATTNRQIKMKFIGYTDRIAMTVWTYLMS